MKKTCSIWFLSREPNHFLRGMEMNLQNLLHEYTRQAPDLSSGTVRKMRSEVNRWLRAGGPAMIGSINKSSIVEFRCRTQPTHRPRTVESAVSTILTLLRFAHEEGAIAAVPAAGRRLRCSVRVKYVPPVEHIGRIYDVVGVCEWRTPTWWRRFITLAYTTGLRLSDLLRLERGHIEGDKISIVARKTEKLQVLPLLPCAAAEIPPWLEGRLLPCPKTPELIRRELSRFCAVAKVPVITPHAIRRCAANAYEAARPGAGSLLLGHSLEGATAAYIHVPAILREAAERLEIPFKEHP